MKRDPIGEAMTAVMTLYPRIYFACHTRHVRDPQSQRLLSRHQASILDHLDELEPTTVMDLAGHMGVTAGTMSLSIDRLERKGYVVRLKDAKDRRRRIYIDGKGDGWIDLTVDPDTGERDLTGITNPWKIASAEDVRDDTGSLHEIGRCW
jgi:DNA-binding transcriptional ArsR family regulator